MHCQHFNKGNKYIKLFQQKNEELQVLDLSWNGFGDEGAVSIGEALEENGTLLKLDLSNNRIGFDGCKALAKAIGINTTLETLSVSKHCIIMALFPAKEWVLLQY